jgi:hypothetical protein
MILLRTGSGELDSEHPVVQGKKRYAHGNVEVDVATAMTMTIVWTKPETGTTMPRACQQGML